MIVLEQIHDRYVSRCRLNALCHQVTRILPRHTSLLDVGCGDGQLAQLIMQKRPDVAIQGIDVLVRSQTAIPVTAFDGQTIPFPPNSFDVVMFVDVLHHTSDPLILLREGVRVARHGIAIKDHMLKGLWARPTLVCMDWIGNRRHGVALPYHYWNETQWQKAIADLHLRSIEWTTYLHLYPFPINILFERSLHFITLLGKERDDENSR